MAEDLPNPGELVSDEVKQIFEDRMDELLVDLGRTITLKLKPSISDCPNCGYNSTLERSNRIYNTSNPNALGALNKPFLDGQRCPVCNDAGVLKETNEVDYTATISKTPKEHEVLQAGIGRMNPNMVKTNTVIGSYDDIKNCQLAKIDGLYYKPIGEAIKTGLQELIRVKQFWERAE